jgi:predicted TPR repeat methyltransferase
MKKIKTNLAAVLKSKLWKKFEVPLKASDRFTEQNANHSEVIKNYWKNELHYDDEWHTRATLAAAEISDGESSFLDIGCGPKGSLRACLPSDCIYVGADLIKWDKDTVICDLERGLFPDDQIKRSDVVFLLGVLEYLGDLEPIFTHLSLNSKKLIFTYCSIDENPDRFYLWNNSYSLPDLIYCFRKYFTVQKIYPYKPGQYIFVVTRRAGVSCLE